MTKDHGSTGESAAATAITVGCVVVVLLLMIGGGLSYFMLGRARVAEQEMAMAQAMAELSNVQLPASIRAAVAPELDRVRAAADAGDLEGQAAVVFIASLTSSPDFLAATLFRLADELEGVDGLTVDERTEGATVLARFAGGVLDRTVSTDLALEIVRAAAVDASAEDTRAWIAGVAERCDALGLSRPARRVDLDQLVRTAVDAVLQGR